MKNNKNMLCAVIMVLIGAFSHSLYGLSDNAVVDSIEAYSNVSKWDLWNLLWLGSVAEPTAAAATVYGMYKAGSTAKQYAFSHPKLIENVFKSASMPHYLKSREPSKDIQGWMTGKWVWAGVSVTAVGIAAYKYLYPRVQAGAIEKIHNYAALCDRLAVAKRAYDSEHSFQNALNQPGNTVWLVSGPIARSYGFTNLIEQGNLALLLIDQLLYGGSGFDEQEINVLRAKITGYIANLKYNQQRFILPALREEEQRRESQRSVYGRELEIQGKEIRNITSQWKLLKDIGNTTGSVIAAFFPNEMKPVIKDYGPTAVLGVGAWKVYNWMTTPKEQEQKTGTGAFGSNKPWDQK